MPAPSRAGFDHLVALANTAVQGLDLSQVPPAARFKVGRAVALSLYVTLCRIQLPPWDEIPDVAQFRPLLGTNANWTIPHTEIQLVRCQEGRRAGQFLFSSETVATADEYYQRVRHLPYTRSIPLEDLPEIVATGGGWLIPYSWIHGLPAWLRAPVMGQAVWKWLALIPLLLVAGLLLRFFHQLSRRGSSASPFLLALAQAALPAYFLLATPTFAYLTLIQLNLTGVVGSFIEMAVTAVAFLAGAWLAWRLAHLVAEAILASPSIAPESIDAHLIRICTRLLGIAAAAGLLALGGDRLGLPLYGIIAGLGVGGLAIALAAQPTIENLIGGLSLFADKPIRVGDFCRYGNDVGTIEAIGLRSTRIRGIDRTLTTIPNAALSKMPVVNMTKRDRMLIKCVVSVRYETTPDQLRFLLASIRELLLAHPRIHPDPARARLVGFGPPSLDIEVFAYVTTSDWNEFLGIREDVLLRIMDLVRTSGTSLAFPSSNIYLARDAGLDASKAEAAQDQVRQWREQGSLPFPDFSFDHLRKIHGTVDFPPAGSPKSSSSRTGSAAEREPVPRADPESSQPRTGH